MTQEIISSYNAERLKSLSNKEESLTNEYLENLEHLQTEFVFNQFFKDDSSDEKKKLKLLNISYSIPFLVGDTLSDYVGEPQNELGISIERQVMAYSWGGYGIFNCQYIEGEFKAEYQTPAGYIKHPNGDEEVINNYQAEENITKRKTYYMLVTRYFNSEGRLENRLYKRNGVNINYGGFSGDEVALDSLDFTKELLPEQKTFLDRSPLVVVHNKKIRDEVYGMSDLSKIESLISSIEISKVNIQDQFLKHLRAKLAIPTSGLPIDSKGVVDIRNLEAIGMEAGDPIPQYIFNSNPLIEKSFEDIESNIRQIGAILKIPTEFFNLQGTGGVESAEAKNVRMSSFIKRVKQIRDKFTVAYEDIVEIARKWGVKLKDEEMMWGEVFPIQKKEQASELKLAKDANLISTKKSIMMYQDLDEAEADAQLEEIIKEKLMIEKALNPQKFEPNNNLPDGQTNPKNIPIKNNKVVKGKNIGVPAQKGT